MVKELDMVFGYLQNEIADLLDINRNHINVKSVSSPVNVTSYSKERTVIFSIDNGADCKAIWIDYDTKDGGKTESLKIITT